MNYGIFDFLFTSLTKVLYGIIIAVSYYYLFSVVQRIVIIYLKLVTLIIAGILMISLLVAVGSKMVLILVTIFVLVSIGVLPVDKLLDILKLSATFSLGAGLIIIIYPYQVNFLRGESVFTSLVESTVFFSVSVLCGEVILIILDPLFRWIKQIRLNKTNSEIDDMMKYNLSPELNGSLVKDIILSQTIDRNDKIGLWYYSNHKHGLVVWKCNSGVFRCHLVGLPGHLVIEISQTKWDPPKDVTFYTSCNKTFTQLIQFIHSYNFGIYSLGSNDCRSFAKDISIFLKSG